MPYRTTRRVEFRDTDAAGIMHFSTFFTYMEEVEHEMLRAMGLSVVMEDAGEPISWPRVSASCDFRGAARFEDVLDVVARIGRIGEKSVTYEFAFSCEDRPVAEGRMVAVCCRMTPGGPLQSIAIPDVITQKLRQAAESGD